MSAICHIQQDKFIFCLMEAVTEATRLGINLSVRNRTPCFAYLGAEELGSSARQQCADVDDMQVCNNRAALDPYRIESGPYKDNVWVPARWRARAHWRDVGTTARRLETQLAPTAQCPQPGRAHPAPRSPSLP